MAEEKDPESTEAIVAELHKKIKEAFEVFDHESNNTVDVEEEEPTGYIRFEKFIPVMTTVLLEKRYRPIAEDVLLRAFEVLDPTKRGFLTKDELVKYMTEEGVLFPWRLPLELELHGEPFSQEEMEEMLSAAIDPESNTINYRDYITMMVIDEN
ncbi:dynein regulatory complex protein 8 isoform X23 [Rattus norvegicus]|uniref:dynein regulatory complex protein 8 isoform X23 n=1 Tax=Rattus norvegicus TaxID=10116 RepID=UPI0019174C64|nr:dynein regulatory complex protein 8 isoform X9 [Rattus norvegicus]